MEVRGRSYQDLFRLIYHLEPGQQVVVEPADAYYYPKLLRVAKLAAKNPKLCLTVRTLDGHIYLRREREGPGREP